ncbi:Bax inhibitor-1/YccA family protein [Enterococcus asini]|uniref:Bax inhibitor-1/YccA family protein n=1 Tax=Enterococcus asini TaxID=57732 RepID=UPI00288D4195|nr:Bax inhibitor-1/YccA family protein [Enterococcus asini]MDT2744715.1 Bax inhibitor-1/YccA family protein [Enterococcus asini]
MNLNNLNIRAPKPGLNITSITGLNRFYAKVYGIFAAGLGLSAVSAYLGSQVFQAQVISFIQRFPLGIWGLWILQLVLVAVMGRKATKNPALTMAGFVVYSLLTGLTLSVTLMLYSGATVVQAFLTATVTFAGAALVGMFIKRDLSMVGRIGMILVWGLIITMLLNVFFFKSSGLDLVVSFIGVLVFTGLTAYDNQMIKNYYGQFQNVENTGIATFVALQLYLDFINIFLFLLRIFGYDDN